MITSQRATTHASHCFSRSWTCWLTIFPSTWASSWYASFQRRLFITQSRWQSNSCYFFLGTTVALKWSRLLTLHVSPKTNGLSVAITPPMGGAKVPTIDMRYRRASRRSQAIKLGAMDRDTRHIIATVRNRISPSSLTPTSITFSNPLLSSVQPHQFRGTALSVLGSLLFDAGPMEPNLVPELKRV
jgi:hypothetical protein